MLRRYCSSWCSAADARALLVVAVIAALTLPGVTRRIYASDEVQYVAFLRSLWFDRDVSFDNEYRQFYANGTTRDPMFAATFIEPATETGLRRNFGTVGSALLWAPFYAAADAGVRAARAMGSTVAADGYSAPYISAVCIGSAVYGLLALLLAWCAARRVLEAAGLPAGPHAVVACAAVGLGTPLLFYMYVAPGFAHATSAFAVAAFVLAWVLVRERWSPSGHGRARRAGRLDGHGPRAGRVHHRRAGDRPGVGRGARPAGAPGRRGAGRERRRRSWCTSRRPRRTSRSTAGSGPRGSSAAR